VGSSSTKKFGWPIHIREKATLDFCPPDKLATVCRAKSPDTPKLPNCRLYSSIGFPKLQKEINTPPSRHQIWLKSHLQLKVQGDSSFTARMINPIKKLVKITKR
jgi:hypothetical protein